MDKYEAMQMAKNKGLDLIQVTEKVEPPVCRIGDFGKYLYKEKKKEKYQKRTGEMKSLRLSFGISEHDMEIRSKSAEKFLKQGNRVKVEMVLRGRELGLSDFAKGKLSRFLENLDKIMPLKVERDLKKEGKNLTIIIAKEQTANNKQ